MKSAPTAPTAPTQYQKCLKMKIKAITMMKKVGAGRSRVGAGRSTFECSYPVGAEMCLYVQKTNGRSGRSSRSGNLCLKK